MKISDLTRYLEELAPLSTQESYDNCGLLTGNASDELKNALICLDCTEDIIDEAVKKKCNLVIAHHPLIFKGIKKLSANNYVNRTLVKAIKNDIAIYAIHTNLDNYQYGVNKKIGEKLKISHCQILQGTQESMYKLVVYVPQQHAKHVLDTLFQQGAGHIGNYSECSFSLSGTGTFRAGADANPFVGKIDERHHEPEERIEVIFPSHLTKKLIPAMITAHPYEEPAYDILPLMNENAYSGAGMFGELEHELDEKDFLQKLKSTFGCGIIRHTPLLGRKIKKVAWCGGSGSFLLGAAKSVKADIFITGDYKYHDFFDAENQIVIADIGHFESEQFTIELLAEIIQKKFPTFAPCLTEHNTNPVNYF
ncbi:MAG: Nif3-like dinuclear metal center hexameric protein [Crocinitomicaceae bacterium]|nr:Nif3-like dinuclear metal center hexameric protein [Crocinitomicaceae bacterium]MBK8924901.1 Nif3-like dinuclear metal center hexameric protein [Crocinitomicaceae bacterium]